jgi:hypothetical protein
MEVGFGFFGEVRVTLFGAIRLALFGAVRFAFLGEVRATFIREARLASVAKPGLIFFRGGLGLFATALVALCRMSLRSLQAPCRPLAGLWFSRFGLPVAQA